MILHVDMDAFYASVEERDDPSLVGKPVIVGGTAEGRGVVAAANYEARKFGVHSAMASARAKRLCPHAVVIRPRIDYYAEVSRQIREIFEQFTPLIEPLSLDEAFLDATGSESLFGPSADIGRQIKQRIRAELQLVASVGVAPNKFVAKIASDVRKPDGFVVVEPGEVQAFLDPLPVGRIWGVGKVTGQVFERLGIRTIGQLRNLSLDYAQRTVWVVRRALLAARPRDRQSARGSRSRGQVDLARNHFCRRHRRHGRAASLACGSRRAGRPPAAAPRSARAARSN